MDGLVLNDYTALNHPYRARMYSSGSQNIGGGSDNIVIQYDTIDYDPAGMLTTGASAKFTAPIPGIWLCIAHVGLSWTNTQGIYFGNFDITTVLPNTVNRHDIGRRSQSAFFTTIGQQSIAQLRLAANDQVQYGLFQNNTGIGVNRPTNGGSSVTYFEVHLMRPM